MARSRHASNTIAKSDEQIVDRVSARREVNVGCWLWVWVWVVVVEGSRKGMSGGKCEKEGDVEATETEVVVEVSGCSRGS